MSREDVLVTADWAEKNLGTEGVVFLEKSAIDANDLERALLELAVDVHALHRSAARRVAQPRLDVGHRQP